MVVVAFPNPFRMAMRRAAPRDISSRILSKIRTFASTDIPTVRTRPASPGRVIGALSNTMIARIISKLASRARQATIPEKR